jgi:alkylation response protein AidB-like acyl-CoA dehydrogenase
VDVTYPAESQSFRAEVREFLDENLPAGWQGIGALAADERDSFTESWRETLSSRRWLAPHWPEEFGGAGLSHLEQVVLHEEFTSRGVPAMGGHDGFGIAMLGNTMLQFGSDEQNAHYLPRIIDGTDLWCQGYSEPDAGSDLAGLGCRAELDGDEWVINGQKIWTSLGHRANMIFTLCRTDPDVPKHQGISFLLVPMDQPGIEVRRIVNIAGQSHFCEVFFSDARCPEENVLGGVNNGWAVANGLLGFERGSGSALAAIRYRTDLDNLIEFARDKGVLDDPIVRDGLARMYTKVEILRFNGYRTLTRFLQGQRPGPESSTFKLWWSQLHQDMTDLAMDIAGPDGLVGWDEVTRDGLQTPSPGTANTAANWMNGFLIARSGTIYAGTSQVQKNIIGERVLGLPKEPRAESGSWREQRETTPI